MSSPAEQPPEVGFARRRPALNSNDDEPFRQSLAALARQLANRGPIEPPPEFDPKIADQLPPEPSEPARQMRRPRPWLGVLALAVGLGIAAIIRALPVPAPNPSPTPPQHSAAVAPLPDAPIPAVESAPSQPLKLDPPPPPPPPAAPIVVAAPQPAAPQPAAPQPAAGPPPKAKLEAYEIMEVQTRLKAIGLNPGPLDGVAGGQTTSAIKNYQSSRGKPPTGKGDGTLLQQLREESERK